MNFRLWATVRSVGPQRYFITVSAISIDDPDRTGGVETGEANTQQDALALRDRLVTRMRDKLVARGHEVADVKLD